MFRRSLIPGNDRLTDHDMLPDQLVDLIIRVVQGPRHAPQVIEIIEDGSQYSVRLTDLKEQLMELLIGEEEPAYVGCGCLPELVSDSLISPFSSSVALVGARPTRFDSSSIRTSYTSASNLWRRLLR